MIYKDCSKEWTNNTSSSSEEFDIGDLVRIKFPGNNIPATYPPKRPAKSFLSEFTEKPKYLIGRYLMGENWWRGMEWVVIDKTKVTDTKRQIILIRNEKEKIDLTFERAGLEIINKAGCYIREDEFML